MNPTDLEDLGAQYGEDYYASYGRGPYSYETVAPYRHGEPLWERYFGQIADLIASELGPRSVLDAGCAIGFLVDALRRRDIEAWGLDISEFAIEHVPEAIREFCRVGSVTDDLDRDYGLIVCIEVLEHLPSDLAPVAVANLCRHADQILFSASPDGFREPTHLNVRPTEYWVELFGRYGLFRNIDVDASVIAPQAIHLVRADQTAVSIAAGYERWHRRALAEVQDLRAAREIGAEAVIRAEEAAQETSLLRRRLEKSEAAVRRAEEQLRRAEEENRRAAEEETRRAEEETRRAEDEVTALLRRLRDLRADVADLRAELQGREAAARQARLERILLERRIALLVDRDAAAQRLEAEIAAINQTRLFRYAAGPRRVYARLRRRGATSVSPPEETPPPEQERPRLVHHDIDAPTEGQVLESDLMLPVRGWVVFEENVVTRIDVVVNGVGCGAARLGISRPDVANVFGTPSAMLSGFETLVDLRDVPGYESGVRIELEVETLAGGSDTIDAGRFELAPPEEEQDEDEEERPREHAAVAPRGREADIRLLVFTHDLGLGGGQLYLFELLRLLAGGDDFAATVVAPSGGRLRRATEALGIPVVTNGAHPVGRIGEYEGRQAQLAAWAREGGFNAILANTFGSFPGVDLAAGLGLPAVWAIHESFDVPGFWRAAYGSADAVDPLVKARAECALGSAGAVVFEAEATRRLYAHHGDAARFVTIPYGIDLEEIDRFAASMSRAEARALLGIRPEAKLLLCLGTIEPRKAQLPMAEAFRAVAPAHPEATLTFVGARRDEFSRGLEDFVHMARLGARIRIEPVTDAIYPWYRAADALLCGSDVESLPRTVLEAMAFSVPVIATRVFGLPELIDDGVTGYLCDPRDTAALAQAIDRFLSTGDEETAAVGAAGAAVVRERHDSRGYAHAYHELLRSLIEDPRRTPAQILADT